MPREHVTTRWTLERETAELDYTRHETFELDVAGVFSYHGRPSHDDPGPEHELELDRVTFRGDPFELTPEEESTLRESWMEELKYGG